MGGDSDHSTVLYSKIKELFASVGVEMLLCRRAGITKHVPLHPSLPLTASIERVEFYTR